MGLDAAARRARQIGRDAAGQARGAQAPPGLARAFGTVTAVGDSTLDVEVAGVELAGLPCTTACEGAAAGDRCLVDTYARKSVVTGILM